MDINFGENPLLKNPNQVYHDDTLKGKGTKESPLKVSVDGLNIVTDYTTGLAGEGTAESPLVIIPEGAILTEDGGPILTEEGEFLIQEGYTQPSDIKKYVALISQNGTEDPQATILDNSLGSITSWTRVDVGTYVLEANDNIFLEPIWFSVTPNGSSDVFIATLYRDSSSEIYLQTFDADNVLIDDFSKLSIEIRIYPTLIL